MDVETTARNSFKQYALLTVSTGYYNTIINTGMVEQKTLLGVSFKQRREEIV
jgi:hypothetical protein